MRLVVHQAISVFIDFIIILKLRCCFCTTVNYIISNGSRKKLKRHAIILANIPNLIITCNHWSIQYILKETKEKLFKNKYKEQYHVLITFNIRFHQIRII